MTVSSTTTKNSYSGDGSQTVFAYGFKIFDDDDVTVIVRTDSTGTETVQTKTTHYSVSGVGNAGGGNITFVTAPATGETVVLLRQTAQTQSTDYTPNDPFPASAHEDALDKLTLIVQDVQEEIDRSIKLSRTNTMTSTEFTVGSTDRANKILAFDSSGELAVTQEIGTNRGNWAASTSYQQRDIVKDTSTNNIFIVNTAHTSSGSQPLTTNANSAKYDLLVDAASATTSATNAAASATAAANSATAAASSESNASTSESNASTSETNASTSETNAATSATAAASSATSAASSATTATTKASEASTSATNAATSETNAGTSETNAATSATNAATSETNAATSATTATTKASEAATSATNAATSATSASTAQTAAETAQTAAEAAQAAAETAADNFDDTYLGAKASDPTVDNDGDALTTGDLYFNTASNVLKVYNGSSWQDAAVDASSFLTTSGGTLTGNLNFGDSVKAQFGAGSDLQVFHDGSNSFIKDAGPGSLQLHVSGLDVLNAAAGEFILRAAENGAVDLYYDNSAKLATTSTGVDVTGTVTADGVESTCAAGDGNLALQAYHPTSTSARDIAKFQSNVGGTQVDQMVIGCDGNVDINGIVTADGLTVDGTAEIRSTGPTQLLIEDTDNGFAATSLSVENGGRDFHIDTPQDVVFEQGGSEVMRILSGGNVGIGTASPNANTKLDLNGAARIGNSTDGIVIENNTGAFGISNAAYIRRNSSTGALELTAGSTTARRMSFNTGTNGAETMRLNTTGQLLLDSEGGTNISVDVRQGSIKQWSQNNGDGAVQDSYNTSSVSDTSNGVFQININNDMDSDDYVLTIQASGSTNSHPPSQFRGINGGGNTLVGSYRVEYRNADGNEADPAAAMNGCFGDLA